MRNCRRFVCLAFVMCLAGVAPLFAQVRAPEAGNEDWRLLIRAQNEFEQGDYGSALSYAEAAKQSRRQDVAWKVYLLENTLKNSRVRSANDKLDAVLPALRELNPAAAQVADQYVATYGMEYFGESFSRLIEFVESLDVYPEADTLIGKVYALDGETALAMEYLNRAYRDCDRLDVYDQKYDILYELAELCRNVGDYEDYEKYLLLVLKDDPQYTSVPYLNALVRTISGNDADTLEKFFRLYRSGRSVSLKALAELARYYQGTGDKDKSLRAAALGAVIAYTNIYQTMQDRRTGWEYATLDGMIVLAGSYRDIAEWGNENRVWELLCRFADVANGCGYDVFARSLDTALASSVPEAYWRRFAQSRVATTD